MPKLGLEPRPLTMTMCSRDLSRLPAETAAVGERVLANGDPYRVIGDHLADILADGAFADMYEATGRNAVWPSLLAMVTLFQFLEKVPDREAARMVVTRIDWKYALHLELDYLGFDFSILCDFRQRILEHGMEALIFDTILTKVQELGFLKKRKQRTDSMAVIGAVRTLSVLEAVSETLRTTLAAMAKADSAWLDKAVPASFRERYLESRPDYKMTEKEREAEMLKAGQDGFWLLEQVDASAPKEIKALEEVGVMRRVWEQRYHRVEGKVAVREKTVKATELILTPHDPGVRAGEKRGKKWQGEKVHVTETAEKGEVNFITDVTTANASGGDAQALPEIRQKLAQRELMPEEQYVDSGYVSGKQIADSEAEGIELIGPPLADTSVNGFKISDFVIDRQARQASCPAGRKAAKWSRRTDRDGSKAINIQFRASDCSGCPLRDRCTSSRSGRSLHLSEHYETLEARRAEAKTEEFKEKMHSRPAIEATLSELVRGHGLRRHRYRGDAKRLFENLLKGAACNLKRLVRALLGRWEREWGAGWGELAVASI